MNRADVLADLLQLCISELDAHGGDYHARTPPAVLKLLKRAVVEPDVDRLNAILEETRSMLADRPVPPELVESKKR